MSKEDQVLEVELDLHGEDLKKFLDIKDDLRLADAAEVLRFLINWGYTKFVEPVVEG
jgi:hypothetical protein